MALLLNVSFDFELQNFDGVQILLSNRGLGGKHWENSCSVMFRFIRFCATTHQSSHLKNVKSKFKGYSDASDHTSNQINDILRKTIKFNQQHIKNNNISNLLAQNTESKLKF